ncbi:MAG: hypothetical protein ABIR70_20590 [Bryobacteraceae bacterium]
MNWGFLGAALARAVSAAAGTKYPELPELSRNSALTYAEEGRGGRIFYSREGKQFSMYFEFGGPSTVALIWIPNKSEWVAQTGLPLLQRDAVLHFIARQVIADKTSTRQNRYEISDDCITIFD